MSILFISNLTFFFYLHPSASFLLYCFSTSSSLRYIISFFFLHEVLIINVNISCYKLCPYNYFFIISLLCYIVFPFSLFQYIFFYFPFNFFFDHSVVQECAVNCMYCEFPVFLLLFIYNCIPFW